MALTLMLLVCTAASSHARLLAGTAKSTQQVVASTLSSLPEINQSVMICNAYAHRTPIKVMRLRAQYHVTAEPIAYKNCAATVVPLIENDQLQFDVGTYEVGTFLAQAVPELSTTLLIVPRRRTNTTMHASFNSHIFKELQKSQVVLIDAYNGHPGGPVQLEEIPKPDPNKKGDNLREASKASLLERRVESMTYNTVRAVEAGDYLLRLPDSAKEYQMNVSSSPSKVVVLRVGTEDGGEDSASQAFPEELALFQSSGFMASPTVLSVLFGALVAALSSMRQ